MQNSNKIIFSLLVLLYTNFVSVYSQTSVDNYLQTDIFLEADGSVKQTDISYFDNLGRVVETVSNKEGSTLHTLQKYDNWGRINFISLPIFENSMNKMDEYKREYYSMLTYSDVYAYSNINNDALGRVTYASTPGRAWQYDDKGKSSEYGVNEKNEVKIYEAPLNEVSLQVTNKYYDEGELRYEKKYDEDGVYVQTYFNKLGQKIMERKNLGCTYFVYNDLGQLRYVLSPEFQVHGYKEDFAYEYRYDKRGRLVKKILPGCKYIQYWYDDTTNKLVFMQDAVLRETNKYRFMLYDVNGRLAVQGICSSFNKNFKSATVEFSLSNAGILGSNYKSIENNLLTPLSIEVINYYDNYDFLQGAQQSAFTDKSYQNGKYSKGRLTASITGTTVGQYNYEAMCYDLKGNIIKLYKKSFDNQVFNISNSYSYSNQVVDHNITYKSKDGKDLVISTRNTYYNASNKIKKTTFNLTYSNITKALEFENDYDVAGRLKTINRPNAVGDVSYTYNVNGWLTSIKTNSFCENLYYEDDIYNCGYFNGNINTIIWSNRRNSDNRGYMFSYDFLNRLTRAVYGERNFTNHENRYNEIIDKYDLNGNIKQLKRRGLKSDGNYGKIDDLNLYYSGNKLCGVYDDASPLNNVNGIDNKYSLSVKSLSYNDNGSLVQDATRDIALIVYDYNNNPITVQFTNGNQIKYIYSARGEKLRAVHYTAMPNISIPMGSSRSLSSKEILCVDSVDYYLSGSLTAKNGILDKYLFKGGYFEFPSQYSTSKEMSNIASYFYNTDHLGNNREVVAEDGTVLQEINYYPFGTPYYDQAGCKGEKVQPYKFGNKEFDMMYGFNTYDFGARQYNPVVPVWNKVDPLCELFQDVSPFTYCHDNPINSIDINGMFDSQDEAINYANSHSAGISNVHYASDQNEWYVAFGPDDVGYSNGGTLERRFHEKASESRWWSTIGNENTDLSTGLGFAGWGMAKPLERSNAYAFRELTTGRYINSAKPTFRFRNVDIDFNLRGANKIASVIKYLGWGSAALSFLMTAYEISEHQKKLIGEGGVDFIMTGVGFIPTYGWAISSAYFLGKRAWGEYTKSKVHNRSAIF